MTTKWTEANIGDQSGKIVLITGANSGIGFEAARALAQNGATVVMGCRNRAKAETAARQIEALKASGTVEILEMDLADLDSVERAAQEFTSRHDHLDILINNAGLMATPNQRTTQGFEMQFGVNHLGHFAFTRHLIHALQAAESARVVSVSSQGHRPGRINFEDLNSHKSYNPWKAYFQSKLANLLFTNELQRRFAQAGTPMIAVAAHPGASKTNLGHEPSGGILSTLMQKTRPFLERVMTQGAAMGALPMLRAATDPNVYGADYFGPDGIGEQKGHPIKVGMSSRAQNAADGERLWKASEELTGLTYSI